MMQNKFTILGSGTCISSSHKPFAIRYPSGYFLQFKKHNFLLDCSEGIKERLEKTKFDYYQINRIFISHFHPDHFSLATFLQSIYVRIRKENEKKEVIIYGPPKIEQRFEAMWDSMHNKGHYLNKFKNTINANFVEFKNQQKIILDGDIQITPYKVVHEDMDAFAMRFELKTKTICYSGDSGYSENLIEAARNSDYFFCESTKDVGSEQNNLHLSPHSAGDIANKAGSKHLILVHYHGTNSDEEMIKDVKKSGFSKQVTVGKDFQIFPI